jgi:hypothetical protein
MICVLTNSMLGLFIIIEREQTQMQLLIYGISPTFIAKSDVVNVVHLFHHSSLV